MAKIIKEMRLSTSKTDESGNSYQTDAVCVIRSNCYDSQLSFLSRLAQEARQTFPDLKDEEITVVRFSGERIKGTFGIEFAVPPETLLPDGWVEIPELEML